MPGISIIIPTYNMRQQLVRCMQSVAAQTLKPDEVIIVDDGSEDGTETMVGANSIRPRLGENDIFPYNFPSITFRHQEHAGASAARNRGFAESKGEYVMFLDADVVLKKHALQRFYETLRTHPHPSGDPSQEGIKSPLPRREPYRPVDDRRVGYVYSSFKWGWKKFSSFPFDAERLKQMPYIHTTSLICRNVLPEKPFDESLRRLQDWDLYLTLLERGYGGVYVPEVLFAVESSGTMSKWLPSIMYQIPFSHFGVTIPALEKYRDAEKAVRTKHGL